MILFPESGASGSQIRSQNRALGAGILPCQISNGSGRNATNPLCPLRCLFNTVFYPEHMIFETVEAKRISVNKRLVTQVLFYDHMGHGQQDCCIRAGPDGDPLGIEGRGRVGIPRIDTDKPGSPFLRPKKRLGDRGSLLGGHRIPAPHDYQIRLCIRVHLPSVFLVYGSAAVGHAGSEIVPFVRDGSPGRGIPAELA